MNFNTKSKIAYTLVACILIVIIIAFGFLLYYLRTQVVVPVNRETTEPTTINKIIDTHEDGSPMTLDDWNNLEPDLSTDNRKERQ